MESEFKKRILLAFRQNLRYLIIKKKEEKMDAETRQFFEEAISKKLDAALINTEEDSKSLSSDYWGFLKSMVGEFVLIFLPNKNKGTSIMSPKYVGRWVHYTQIKLKA